MRALWPFATAFLARGIHAISVGGKNPGKGRWSEMKEFELTRPSLSVLLRLIEEQPAGLRHLFRGQADADWHLLPSLYRIPEPNIHAGTREQNYDAFENSLINLFFNEARPYLPSVSRGFSEDRILAQHFGVPTRLLDWSQDPLVATYFAVESWNLDTDAAVFMVLPDARHLPEHVRSLGPHKVVAFTPPAIDRRIPAQKSIFTHHPYGPAAEPFVPLDQREDIGNLVSTGPNQFERGFAKIRIPRRLKRLLYQNLLGSGIDRRNLFPGLDGVGADIALRAWCGQSFRFDQVRDGARTPPRKTGLCARREWLAEKL